MFGTRPEAIKMAPVVKAFEESSTFESRVCVTAQHREMLDQALELFDIEPDYDLDLMRPRQSLNEITGLILLKLKPILQNFRPNLVLVHGDTATTFASTLAAYYAKIDVGHVEAGLRTGNIYSPWPEEVNRKLTSSIARFHFAPTNLSKQNLIDEGITSELICVSGNTVIDALFSTINKIHSDRILEERLLSSFQQINLSKRLILVTGHRRENFGSGIGSICEALAKLASERNDIEIVYPVHLNPNIKEPVEKHLSEYNNIHLMEPLDYLPFIFLMMKAHIILTDSGGIQEEAPSLGKPVLVMRDTTERPEAVNAGTVKLVGTNVSTIISQTCTLLDDTKKYSEMSSAVNPFGDGRASSTILNFIEEKYEV